MIFFVLSCCLSCCLLCWLPTAAATTIAPLPSAQYSVAAAASTPLPSGIITRIGRVTKHPSNPLFIQDKPWEPRLDNGYPNIIHHPTLDTFECFYGDCVSGCGTQLLLYANSTDGLIWNKPNLNSFDLGNVRPDLKTLGKKNNIILKGGGIGIYYDEHALNVSQRYKAFGEGCYGAGGNTLCSKGGTATSSNGLVWSNIHNVNWPKPHRKNF